MRFGPRPGAEVSIPSGRICFCCHSLLPSRQQVLKTLCSGAEEERRRRSAGAILRAEVRVRVRVRVRRSGGVIFILEWGGGGVVQRVVRGYSFPLRLMTRDDDDVTENGVEGSASSMSSLTMDPGRRPPQD